MDLTGSQGKYITQRILNLVKYEKGFDSDSAIFATWARVKFCLLFSL